MMFFAYHVLDEPETSVPVVPELLVVVMPKLDVEPVELELPIDVVGVKL